MNSEKQNTASGVSFKMKISKNSVIIAGVPGEKP